MLEGRMQPVAAAVAAGATPTGPAVGSGAEGREVALAAMAQVQKVLGAHGHGGSE
jgi:hypothetical protein